MNNIVLHIKNNYLIMNLINFRREYLSKDQIQMMESIEEKIQSKIILQEDEQFFYETLLEKKQILTEEMISVYESKRRLLEEEPFEEKVQIRRCMLNLSYKCNFHCEYCYQKEFTMDEKMTVNKIDAIYLFLKEYAQSINKPFEMEQIIISGGEPLLDENINIIQYIIKKFGDVCLKFKLFTNGTFLHKQLNNLDINRISDYQISIDGIDDVMKLVNNHNGENILDNLLKSIDVLKKNEDTSIAISIMLCDIVVEHLEQLISEFEKHELLTSKNVRILMVSDMNFDITKGKNKYIYKDERTYLGLRKKAQKIIGDKNINVQQLRSVSSFSKALKRPMDERWKGKTRSCNVEVGVPVTFGPEGNIYWCTCIDQQKGIIGRYFPDYRIDKEKISEFRFRSIYNQKECQECSFRYVCGGGCHLSAIKNSAVTDCGMWKRDDFLENLEDYLS